MRRIFFLNPPSFDGFDGGAGSRYQARREVRSFWYPTWLAQSAALCPESKLLDAPAAGMDPEATVRAASGFDMVVMYTSTPGYSNDARLAECFKRQHPRMLVGMVGSHPTAAPEQTLLGCDAVDFVARGEFDYSIAELAEGLPLCSVDGISFRQDGRIVHTKDREPIQDMDALPSVLDVYKRDLVVENYVIGYLLYPYLSVYTGRGCPGKCIFCLWPQTIAGHGYRARSVDSVVDEMVRAKQMFPQVREFFFDDDTFTVRFHRAEEIARALKKLNITWSCSSRANVPEKTLRIMKEGGLRCVMVGIESGSDEILRTIKKGVTTAQIHAFMKTCRKLGIITHATFMVGLPGETKETLKQTVRFARQIDPDTIQVSVATPYPGTEFYRKAVEHGWLIGSGLVSDSGIQQAAIEYPDLTGAEIFNAVQKLYSAFYFRPKPILRILCTMLTNADVCVRRLREAKEFFFFMRNRKKDRPQGARDGCT